MDGILVFTKGDWVDYVQNNLKEKGLKCNSEKPFFGQTKIECLGLWVTCNGVKYLNINTESITNMKPTTYRKYLQHFIGAVNYYRDMLERRSYKLLPSTKIISNEVKLK